MSIPTFRSVSVCTLSVLLMHCEYSAPSNEKSVRAGTALAISNPAADCFPNKVTIRHAKNFRVSYQKNYKVVTVQGNSPDQALTVASKLVLVQRGTPAPQLSGELAHATLVEVPARTAAVWVNEDVALLHLLGVADRVIVTGPKSGYRELQEGYRSGRIRSTGSALNKEVLLDANPDVVIALAAIKSHEVFLDELRALGLRAAGQYSWLERDALGRAEWIKFVSLFFNREREAELLFSEVESSYSELAARARAAEKKPDAFWATPNGAAWSCSRNDWEAALLNDAGARNVLADNGPSRVVLLSDEFVVESAAQADSWITLEPGNLRNGPSWTRLKAFRTGRVYDPYRPVAGLNGPEFSGIAGYRPDLMLRDLVSIFHPELLPHHQLLFFQRKNTEG
jgi:cobalamin transport system substrate-binding protein